ncbi:MAG: hypothetical protein ACTSRA_18765, partial [Promethearchaeota archaeon]
LFSASVFLMVIGFLNKKQKLGFAGIFWLMDCLYILFLLRLIFSIFGSVIQYIMLYIRVALLLASIILLILYFSKNPKINKKHKIILMILSIFAIALPIIIGYTLFYPIIYILEGNPPFSLDDPLRLLDTLLWTVFIESSLLNIYVILGGVILYLFSVFEKE